MKGLEMKIFHHSDDCALPHSLMGGCRESFPYGRIQLHILQGRFIEDVRFSAVTRIVFGKTSSVGDRHIVCFDKVMVDRHKSRIDSLIWGASLPVEIADPALDIRGQVAAAGDALYIGVTEKFLPAQS